MSLISLIFISLCYAFHSAGLLHSVVERVFGRSPNLELQESPEQQYIFHTAAVIGKKLITDSEPKCNRDFILPFLKPEKQINRQSFKLGAKFTSLCPRITKTCCHFSEYLDLVRQYQAGKVSLNRTVIMFNRIIQILKEAGHDEVFKKVQMHMHMMELSQKELNGDYKFDSNDLRFIFDNLENAKIKLTLVVDFYLRFYSSVACELCNASNHKHIYKNPVSSRVHITFSRKRALEYIKISKLFSELHLFLFRLVRLFNYLSCDPKNKLKVPLASLEKYTKRVALAEYCEIHFKERNSLRHNDLCYELFDYFSSFTRSSHIDNIAQIVHYGSSNLLDYLYGRCSRVSSIKKLLREWLPCFLKAVDKDIYFGKFRVIISSDEGWSMLEKDYANIQLTSN